MSIAKWPGTARRSWLPSLGHTYAIPTPDQGGRGTTDEASVLADGCSSS